MSFAIRPARRADAAAVAELWHALLDEHGRFDAAFAVHASARDALAARIARAIGESDAAVWLACREDVSVGFCAAQVERASAPLVERVRAEVTELWVAPSARRCGIGRALADAALAWAKQRGAARVEARVSARNAEGQAFWRAIGFGDFVDVLDRRL